MVDNFKILVKEGYKILSEYTGSDIEVNIPSSIDIIGEATFAHHHELRSVFIPEGVMEIESWAFRGCKNLNSIFFPNSIKKIGAYAFADCLNLVSVVLPEGLQEMHEGVFKDCKNLSSIDLPNSLREIGYSAFENCEKIMAIEIQEGITQIRFDTFFCCTSLATIFLPESIKEIEGGAFSACRNLKSIVIPENVNKIGSNAFSGCESLVLMKIPQRVSTIEYGAFAYCINLESINIPDGIHQIKERAFYGCKKLSSINIPEGVTTLGNNSFTGCVKLTSIIIPRSTTTIGDEAFKDCIMLKEVQILGVPEVSFDSFIGTPFFENISSDYKIIGDQLVAYLGKAHQPNLPNGIKVIKSKAFKTCDNLTSLTIPEGVISIEEKAFFGCHKLESIKLPESLEEIGEGAFADCSSLTSINIPINVVVINIETFINCNNLRSIKFPESLKVIKGNAFKNCSCLKLVTIPRQVIDISNDAFPSSTKIGIVYKPESIPLSLFRALGNKYINLLDRKGKIIGKIYNLFYSVSENVSLGEELGYFYKSHVLRYRKDLIDHLSEYDTLFFHFDTILIKKINSALARLEYPLELTEEFEKKYIIYLRNFADLIIPGLIKDGDIKTIHQLGKIEALLQKNINDYIDQAINCSQLEIQAYLMEYKNRVFGINPQIPFDLTNQPGKEWDTLQNWSGTLTIRKYLGDKANVIIPAMVDCKRVSRIEGNLGSLKVSIFFPNQNLIKSVTIEEGIKEIGQCAFDDCKNLESICIPSSLVSIDITVEQGDIIDDLGNGNWEYDNLNPYTFSENISYAFNIPINDRRIFIPENVIEITDFAFANFEYMKVIIIPESVKKIGNHAFEKHKHIVIYAPKDSYAIEYAKEHDIRFKET